jgi:hypothetical protein
MNFDIYLLVPIHVNKEWTARNCTSIDRNCYVEKCIGQVLHVTCRVCPIMVIYRSGSDCHTRYGKSNCVTTSLALCTGSRACYYSEGDESARGDAIWVDGKARTGGSGFRWYSFCNIKKVLNFVLKEII